MNAEEIAMQVKEDIIHLARQWKYKHAKRTPIMSKSAATETAALYLQANHSLYFRDNRQDMKDAHQKWMLLMQEWFLATVERRTKKAGKL